MGLFTSSSPSETNAPKNPDGSQKYLLHITAGPSHPLSTHTTLPINTPHRTPLSTPLLTTHLSIRINPYSGLPHPSPHTSPYFTHAPHTSDRFSIAFSFVPTRDVAGGDLLMGFEGENPVRDRLPGGTKAAVRVVTGVLDPGLEVEPYLDRPFVLGPVVSGGGVLCVGEMEGGEGGGKGLGEQVGGLAGAGEFGGLVVEGGVGGGEEVRRRLGVPCETKKRRKFFLDEGNLKSWVWEKGRVYHVDFCGPWLDFEGLAVRVPGVKVGVQGAIGEKTHRIRFVVKEKKGGVEPGAGGGGDEGVGEAEAEGEVGLVVAFTLLYGKDIEEAVRKEEEGGKGGERRSLQEEGRDRTKERDGVSTSSRSPKPPTHDNTSAHPHPSTPASKSKSTANSTPTSASVPPTNNNTTESTTEATPSVLSTATSTLTKTLSAGMSALGFGAAQPDSGSPKEDSPAPSASSTAASRRLDAQVDGMSDETVTRYLQDRHSSLS